jgi:7-cyano-7-deazaguanine synthase in queuosine biosynthesis
VESIQKLKIPVMIAVHNHFADCTPETVPAFQKMLKPS